MHAPRLPFDASAPFVARTDFAHGRAEYKAGAPFDKAGLGPRDLFTLWRTALIDCAPRAVAEPVPAPPPAAKPPAAPPAPKPPRTPRTAARS